MFTSKRMLLAVPVAAILLSMAGGAQGLYVPPPAGVTQSDLAALAATIPAPADTPGPGEVVGGAAGTANTYKRGDWTPMRLSRTGNCTLDATGTCFATWTSAFPAGTVPKMFGDPTPVNSAAQQPINCNTTATPTIIGVQVKCWIQQNTILNLSLVTAGVTVSPNNSTSLSGVAVTAAAIPASQ